jgi:excisionase family DNA binding protein
LPASVHEILARIVERMQEGNAIAVMPLMEELSTQAAADLLGVSRQFFVRECEAHKLPFHYTGTHRRVLLKDLLDHKKQREQARREAITRIARHSEELGDYDKFIPTEGLIIFDFPGLVFTVLAAFYFEAAGEDE